MQPAWLCWVLTGLICSAALPSSARQQDALAIYMLAQSHFEGSQARMKYTLSLQRLMKARSRAALNRYIIHLHYFSSISLHSQSCLFQGTAPQFRTGSFSVPEHLNSGLSCHGIWRCLSLGLISTHCFSPAVETNKLNITGFLLLAISPYPLRVNNQRAWFQSIFPILSPATSRPASLRLF